MAAVQLYLLKVITPVITCDQWSAVPTIL